MQICEDLCNQEHVVKLMLLYREEFWRNEIAELKTLILVSTDCKPTLLEQIGAIAKTRLEAVSRIRRLKEVELHLNRLIAPNSIGDCRQVFRNLKRHSCGAGRFVTKCTLTSMVRPPTEFGISCANDIIDCFVR
jgi:hypothetical protein